MIKIAPVFIIFILAVLTIAQHSGYFVDVEVPTYEEYMAEKHRIEDLIIRHAIESVTGKDASGQPDDIIGNAIELIQNENFDVNSIKGLADVPETYVEKARSSAVDFLQGQSGRSLDFIADLKDNAPAYWDALKTQAPGVLEDAERQVKHVAEKVKKKIEDRDKK